MKTLMCLPKNDYVKSSAVVSGKTITGIVLKNSPELDLFVPMTQFKKLMKLNSEFVLVNGIPNFFVNKNGNTMPCMFELVKTYKPTKFYCTFIPSTNENK